MHSLFRAQLDMNVSFSSVYDCTLAQSENGFADSQFLFSESLIDNISASHGAVLTAGTMSIEHSSAARYPSSGSFGSLRVNK